MTAIFGSLQLTATSTNLTYGTGAGEFIYLMPEAELDPLVALEYYVLNCASMLPDSDFGGMPARLLCSAMAITTCTSATCSGSPPPPSPPPHSRLAVRVGLGFQPQFIDLGLIAGPAFSQAYDAMPDIETIRDDVAAWIDLPQDPPLVIHLYWLEDPNAGTQTPHPLHQHIIGIPVGIVPPFGPR